MAKKKKSKKQRKVESKKTQNMKPEHLILQGNEEITSGNIRKAITLYKQALKNNGNANEINLLLFKAYLLREQQLSGKGMKTEAEAIRSNAMAHKPDAGMLSEEDLLLCLNVMGSREGGQLYADYSTQNGFLPTAEKTIAGKLILSGDLSGIEAVGEESPLKSCMDHVQAAVAEMNRGMWKEALNCLKPVPRSSPWAELKLFCKAMHGFTSNDNTTLARSLSGLSEDFPFSETVRGLSQYKKEGEGKVFSGSPRVGELLFNGQGDLFQLVSGLAENVYQGKVRGLEDQVRSIAQNLYPGNTVEFIKSILEIISQSTAAEASSPFDFLNLALKLLTPEDAKVVVEKARFNNEHELLSNACQYLQVLDREFADKHENAIARSQVLTYVASEIVNGGFQIFEDIGGLEAFEEIVPITDPDGIDEYHLFCFDLIEHALNLDPDNREAYELAGECSHAGINRKRVERLFEKMLDRFPEDPYPCLKLADIYDRKGANRKAENILKEAMKRAPQNNKVKERYAFSFVVSAEKNLNSGKFHLVERDLLKAEEFHIASLSDTIRVKKMVLTLMRSTGQNIDGFINQELSGLQPDKQVRNLSLLVCDMESKNSSTKKLDQFYKKLLKETSKQFSSASRAAILAPLSSMDMLVYSGFDIADKVLNYSTGFLKGITDDDFINMLQTCSIVREPTIKLFIKDLKQRVKKASNDNKPLLDFCCKSLMYMDNELNQLDTLFDITEEAPQEVRERMKIIARQIAPAADTSIRGRFLNFDFEPFNPFGLPGLPGLEDLLGIPEFDGFDDDLFLHDDEDDFVEFPGFDMIGQMDGLATFVAGISKLNKRSKFEEKQRFIKTANHFIENLFPVRVPGHMIIGARDDMLELMPLIRNNLKNAPVILGEELMERLTDNAYIFLSGTGK